MRRLFLFILLFLPAAFAVAQAVNTRDNYTGLWTDSTTWNQAWGGITNPNPLPMAQIEIFGYVSLGRLNAVVDMQLAPSASSVLKITDTLRVYGSLTIGQNAELIVESGGVLIIHGSLVQANSGKVNNKGTIIVASDFKGGTKPGPSSNIGNIYVGGITDSGSQLLFPKALTELATDDPVTDYFYRTNIINSHCAGNNSGTLTFSGSTSSIGHWESSTDYFKKDKQVISNNTSQLNYNNLQLTTSYRVYFRTSSGAYAYSNGASIFIKPQYAGDISGPTEFCATAETATFTLANNTGSVKRWEWSTDNFATAPRSEVSSSQTFSLSNLTTTTYLRALVEDCSEVYTASFKITVPPASQGGTLLGAATVCAGNNSSSLQLQNYVGQVLRWERSTDHFASNIETIANTTAELRVENLTVETSYRALVMSGSCGEAVYSEIATIAVAAVSQGGIISGPATVCKGTNSGTLSLADYQGLIERWEYSDDGFVADIQTIAETTDAIAFSNLSSNRWYRAVVKSGVCEPAYSTAFEVAVTEVVGGMLSGPDLVCAENNTGTLQLQDYLGDILRWERSNDGFQTHVETLAHTQADYTFTNISADTWFRVVVGNNDCGERVTTGHMVRVDEASHGGTISGTSSVCKGTNTGTLSLSDHRGQILRWEYSTDGFNAHVQAIANTGTMHTFSNLSSNHWYRAVVQNGSCAPAYSSVAEITLVEPSQAGSVAGAAMVCKGQNSGTLSLQSKVGAIVRWESSTDNFNTIIPIAHTGDNLSYQNLSITTAYRAVVQNSLCDLVYSEVATITVSPDVVAGQVAGSTTVASGANAGELQLQDATGTVVYWESSTDGFVSDTVSLENTGTVQRYENLTQTSWYRAVVQNGDCELVYATPAKITVNHAPLAQTDTLLISEAIYTSQQSVLQNDTDPDGNTLRVVSADGPTAAGGYASMAADGILYYEAPENYLGYDALAYTVCDNVSGAELCAEAAIVLDVRLPAPELIVYQGVSPNGDEHNDYWRIEFIERYPENIVQLYDRLGMLVYEQQGYDNQERTFIGVSNKGIHPGGIELPEGTYFYKIITSRQAPVLQGYIVLKK